MLSSGPLDSSLSAEASERISIGVSSECKLAQEVMVSIVASISNLSSQGTASPVRPSIPGTGAPPGSSEAGY